jgi:N-acetylmuramoyl-L-alanine amidase
MALLTPSSLPKLWQPSPNFDKGRQGQYIAGIVLHGTAGGGAVEWFQNPASRVSAHYVVLESGGIVQCVNDSDTAWHAGEVSPGSNYATLGNPNLWTIGIEHERDRSNSAPMPEAQIEAGLALVGDLLTRYGWLVLIPHDAISLGRTCPGPGFPLALYLGLLASSGGR